MHSSSQSLLSEKRFFITYLLSAIKKAPKGKSETPWSLHMRPFWKIRFINSPEEQGKFLLIQNNEISLA